jgi:hypothetical protein
VTFLDPCNKQPREARAAVYQHLRKQAEKETTPEILQQLGQFDEETAEGFIDDVRRRCPGFRFMTMSIGEESGSFSVDVGLWEHIVVVRRGDVVMTLDYLTFANREQFNPSEIERLTTLADEKFADVLNSSE